MNRETIENNFTYHKPHGDQPARYEALRAKAKEFAIHISENTPASAEQTLALRHLEEAMMWANASIARNEPMKGADPGTPEHNQTAAAA